MTLPAQTIFQRHFLSVPRFQFNESFISDGPEPYSNQVFNLDVKQGRIVSTIDNNGLRVLIVGTGFGNLVVHEHISRDTNNEAIDFSYSLFAEEGIQWLLLGTLDSDITDKDMLTILGDGLNYENIGCRLFNLRRLVESSSVMESPEIKGIIGALAHAVDKKGLTR